MQKCGVVGFLYLLHEAGVQRMKRHKQGWWKIGRRKGGRIGPETKTPLSRGGGCSDWTGVAEDCRILVLFDAHDAADAAVVD